MTWQGILKSSAAEERRNNLSRGVSYTSDPKQLTVDAVAEYVAGFGGLGVGAREVTEAVGRDERGVKRALQTLVEDGQLRVTEQITRGPKASKRKVYHPIENPGALTISLSDLYLDYFGTPDQRVESEHGAGGGRAIPPYAVD